MPEVEDPSGHVVSPYAGKRLTMAQHLAISSFWFGSNMVWGALLMIVLGKQLEQIAPEHKAQALGFTGLVALVALAVPLVSGALSDRCMHRWGRRRPYMLVGGIVNVIGLGLMFWASQDKSYPLYLGAYCVVQFGNNIATGSYNGVIPDLVPEDQRGVASGYMGTMSQLGTLVGILSSGFLIGSMPMVVYAIMAGILSLSLFVSLRFIEETPLTVQPPKLEWLPYVKSLWIDPRKHPDFAWVWLTRFLVMMGFYSVQPFAQYYFNDVIGISRDDMTKTVGMFFASFLVAASLSGILGGHLSDRIGRKRVVYYANSLIALTTMSLAFCRTLTPVFIFGTIFGIGFGAYVSVDWALGTDVLPSKISAAKDMAVWHISMVLPQSLTQPVAGLMLASHLKYMETVPFTGERIAHYKPSGYAILFIMSSIYFALGAFLLKNVKKVR